MTSHRFIGVSAVVLCLLSTACASSGARRGRALFGEGRLIEAAEVFEHSESRLPEFDPADRAAYGLFRGMTLLRLGDLESAAHWLSFAQSAELASPGALGETDRRDLREAFHRLELASASVPRSGPLPRAFVLVPTSDVASMPNLIPAAVGSARPLAPPVSQTH